MATESSPLINLTITTSFSEEVFFFHIDVQQTVLDLKALLEPQVLPLYPPFTRPFQPSPTPPTPFPTLLEERDSGGNARAVFAREEVPKHIDIGIIGFAGERIRNAVWNRRNDDTKKKGRIAAIVEETQGQGRGRDTGNQGRGEFSNAATRRQCSSR